MNSSGSSSGKTRETVDATGLNYGILPDFALGKLGLTLYEARLVPEGALRVESRKSKGESSG
jgi:hypothetical protein